MDQRNYLVIETSNQASSLALLCDNHIYHNHQIVGNQHSNHLHQQLMQLLEQANTNLDAIDEIIVGNGPGMFTGIRIGLGFAQGLGLGLQIPVTGYSSLMSMAAATLANVDENDFVFALIDAKMSEVYGQWFKKDINHDWIVLSDAHLYQSNDRGQIMDWIDELKRYITEEKAVSPSVKIHAVKIHIVGDGIALLPEKALIDEYLKNQLSGKCKRPPTVCYEPSIMPAALPLLKAIINHKIDCSNSLGKDNHSSVSGAITANYVRNDVAHKARKKEKS